MARHPRALAAGVYHVTAHASDDRPLFLDDADRRLFLEMLDTAWATSGLELISYVLMSNHYHTLTWIPDVRLSEALQRLHGGYSRCHNKRHRRMAHLFRAHCITRRINDSGDLLGTERYLARDPLRAGMVRHVLDWPWGSARAHAGLEPACVSITERRLRGAFEESANWRDRYAALVGT